MIAPQHDAGTASGAPERSNRPASGPPPRLTIRSVLARAVDVPLSRPVRAAVGDVPTAPLVLIDVHTDQGVVGRSYIFGYTPKVLGALVRFIADITPDLVGRAVVPADLMRHFDRSFKLLGWQGLVGMAVGGLDMAFWDALGKASGLAVAALLGAILSRCRLTTATVSSTRRPTAGPWRRRWPTGSAASR